MLVLSRKENQRVMVEFPDGPLVEVMVVEIRGDKVRLGFVAPPEVPIHREEIWVQIQGGIDTQPANPVV